MPRRRPLHDGHVNVNILIIVALLLIGIVGAQQQQRRVVDRESPHEGHTLEATKIPPPVVTPGSARRKKTAEVDMGKFNNINDNNNKKKKKNDASALVTLAPADSAVEAPPARRPSPLSAGLTSPQKNARNLEDWEVEDFVLLATVDGKLHARGRKTGKRKWEVSSENPMVKTEYHRPNRSSVDADYNPNSIDEYLWIVEPSPDGNLFVYQPNGPNPGLVDTGLTMKKLAGEMSPYYDQENGIIYNGLKKTSMITVDANSGEVLTYYGSEGALDNGNCKASDGKFDSDECKFATLAIGRLEYEVQISGKKDHRQIATLRFSEWIPNTYDNDLHRQYHKSMDNSYIYTTHDGGVIALDLQGNSEAEGVFQQKFDSPVARVFDIARPWGADKNNPELILLPQPPPPLDDDTAAQSLRESRIFLNHTEDGSWFAMSGLKYPLAVRENVGRAQCTQEGWMQHHPQWDITDHFQLSEALVGLHSIDGHTVRTQRLAISGPQEQIIKEVADPADNTLVLADEPTYSESMRQYGRDLWRDYVLALIANPLIYIVITVFIVSNQREIRTTIGKFYARITSDKAPSKSKTFDKASKVDKLPQIPEDKVLPPVEGTPSLPSATIPPIEETKQRSRESPALSVEKEEKTKKAHRGRRGGVKHKKGRANSQTPSEDGKTVARSHPTVEDAVRNAQQLGQQTKLEPDIQTKPSPPDEVSGPVIRIGALEVNTDKLIGTGSNGTLVFEGNFDGRDVAVKRMLIQFFDIASQETKLLRESDDHPNVIRYYAQQSAGEFLYIALELCPASLADVIDKPQRNRDLAQAGERDLPNVLYQITNGLQHLHKLRIVHRDLKPQNILVAMGKDGKPRLLVSDFGLCKKLEGEQSSFRATTAHAAGTSGWRAPELLLDDDAKDGNAPQAMVDASTDGNSGSLVLNPDLLPNRRATRAIDIFSLGLVFFYVLTKGSHPFDCGDKFMREVNIRKGLHNLEPLQVLGDYAYEAKDLINSMLMANPKERPSALNVMAHPFFWSPKKRLNFLCDVSDHFEKEPREPPSDALTELERHASAVCRQDFLRHLGKEFVDSMGKQRKYTGTRLLDLLRALRNKKNHYEDLSDKLKEHVGPLPDGYLSFWTRKFPNLLITCWNVVYNVEWDDTDRFREYYSPASGV
ncbi:hypothetical protein LZ554_002340 [Drepanopeziza brunnea f. sp. 'monogermtubi']|nr:hypothetical protein LZ554_002340 [Drepanopeziza brunnea f. sp. 'monogermtubi']